MGKWLAENARQGLMRILGINDSSHDAAVSVIDGGKIVFATHGERINKEKHSFSNPHALFGTAMEFGEPDVIAYFEHRNKKRLRNVIHGGINGAYEHLYRKTSPALKRIPEIQVGHHKSHAAAGYYTSTFDDATIVVIDAIGEFDTLTVWDAKGSAMVKRGGLKYPTSFGLFYSAFTQLLGLKPGIEEYILMGMSAFGYPGRYIAEVEQYFPKFHYQPYNMHYGVPEWPHKIRTQQDKFDIAAAVQQVYEERLRELMQRIRRDSASKNLVFTGGCALNCAANAMLWDIWDHVWIMPNPGDAGSSLGAALAVHGEHVRWQGPYLGHAIGGSYPIGPIVEELTSKGIVAVANGRAEFGPRALGNRSILADPRTAEMKQKVNTVKKREQFRPFAPVVLEEDAHEYFDLDRPSPYMQFAVRCKRPDLLPAVIHKDGTSRVQTVNQYQHFGLYEVLQRWKTHTGIPVLLNTSLNVKNQPLLDDIFDVDRWRQDNPHVRILS